MANYGIKFCQRGIREIEAAEEKLFETQGHGFDYFSKEIVQLRRYKTLLAKFTKEKEDGRLPTYNPTVHGYFGE